MTPDKVREFALSQELLDSIRLIRSGFGQLQQLDGANDFYHMPLLTLSSGFERLLKVTLCFRLLEVNGNYPTPGDMPSGRKGHDLEFLLGEVRKRCFLPDYVDNIPVAKIDLEYLSSDELLSFIRILGCFGQAARYHYLDVVLGRNPTTDAPDREWERLETNILLGKQDLIRGLEANPESQEVFREIATQVVSRLERFARALTRLYTIGEISSLARRYTPYIGGFLFLKDEDLGKKQYKPFGAEI